MDLQASIVSQVMFCACCDGTHGGIMNINLSIIQSLLLLSLLLLHLAALGSIQN